MFESKADFMQHFSEILNYLFTNCNLGSLVEGDDRDCIAWDLLPDHIDVMSGCTRFVIIDNDYPYVCKVQYHGKIDYNKTEAENYQRARLAGLEDWFCPIEKAGEYNYENENWEHIYHLDLYMAERCDCDYEELSDMVQDSSWLTWCDNNNCNPNNYTSEEYEEFLGQYDEWDETSNIKDYFYAHYDEDVADKLFNFIDESGINDLHCGNWGWFNDHLVAVDYAGYQE